MSDHHHHHHHHHHHFDPKMGVRFIWAIAINIIYVVCEFYLAFRYDSVGLLADAGHNLCDVAKLDRTKEEVKEFLHHHNIHHSTLEFEKEECCERGYDLK